MKKINWPDPDYPKKLMLVLMLAMLAGGCAGWSTAPSVCDNPPSKSYICEAAHELDLRVELVGDALIAINTAAISFDAYTKEDALIVINGLRGALTEPISYTVFVLELDRYLLRYPGLIEVVKPLMQRLDKLLVDIVAYDVYLLLTLLDEMEVQIKNL